MIGTTLLLKMGIAALCAAVLAALATPLVSRLATRAGVVRYPRERDVHSKGMPLWGGLAMFVAFMLTVLLVRVLMVPKGLSVAVGEGQHPILGILLGATLIAVVGLLDDKYDLPPSKQTLSLLAGGFIAAVLGARIEGITNPFAGLPGDGHAYTSENYKELPIWLSVPLTMIWVFLVAKTFDFMDGLDGLAAGVCAIAATTMGLVAAARGEVTVALMAAALTGACLGFLRHNYNPASIFMGTIGAQFLGFVLAMLAIVGSLKLPATIALVVPLLVLGVPVFDGLYVVGRRVVQGKGPTVADRTHIHHRFTDRGLSVKQAVWAIYGLTASGCALALLLAWFGTRR
jgi:UDP-GlcNAc:undecaprenyl-phosphate GlcNAc-1-phosphate transferase